MNGNGSGGDNTAAIISTALACPLSGTPKHTQPPEVPVDAAGHVRHLKDSSESRIAFNVMPDRPVREEMRIREFRIAGNRIEAAFDRTYVSSMLNSPSHLTFVAALVQMQKIAYVYCCHRLGFDPNVQKPEVLKIWPTTVNIVMRDLVREEQGSCTV